MSRWPQTQRQSIWKWGRQRKRSVTSLQHDSPVNSLQVGGKMAHTVHRISLDKCEECLSLPIKDKLSCCASLRSVKRQLLTHFASHSYRCCWHQGSTDRTSKPEQGQTLQRGVMSSDVTWSLAHVSNTPATGKSRVRERGWASISLGCLAFLAYMKRHVLAVPAKISC